MYYIKYIMPQPHESEIRSYQCVYERTVRININHVARGISMKHFYYSLGIFKYSANSFKNSNLTRNRQARDFIL